MSKEYEGELDSEKGYWADVHHYMEHYNCDKEKAIKAIDKIYEDYWKKRNTQSEENIQQFKIIHRLKTLIKPTF